MFDLVGILILIVLMVGFGFLTVRAWKARNRWLRWIGGLLFGLLTILPLVLLTLALIGYGKLNARYNNPVPNVQVARTPAQVARGQQLANICVSCHTPGNQLPLSGSNFAAKFGMPPLGTLYAPNLTPSGNISDWTDGELIRAIREGVHKNGRSLLIMPSANFHNMSDEDVEALVAYLRSQPARGGPTPSNQLNVLGAIFTNLADFRVAQPPAGQVTAPQPGTPEYGKYLVDVVGGCRDCHGAQLQGGVDRGAIGPPAGPNLTQIIPKWSEAEFMTFFNTGTMPGGAKVPILTLPSGFSEPRMPWPTVRASASDEDLKAMYAYLHSLKPIDGPTR
jgi:mono/diheme cytochrome c family protein